MTTSLVGAFVLVDDDIKKPIDILFNLEHPEGGPADVTDVDEDDVNGDIEEIEIPKPQRGTFKKN